MREMPGIHKRRHGPPRKGKRSREQSTRARREAKGRKSGGNK